jgi:hypothetical protein
MTETIYIPLEDEDVSVRRPARAYPLGDGKYIVLRPADYDPSAETWAFPPGSIVECQMLPSQKGDVPTAVRRVAESDTVPGRQAV